MTYAFSFKEILDQTNDVVIVTDAEIDPPGPKIRYVNDAFVTLTGYSRDAVIGSSPRFLQGTETSAKALAALRRALHNQAPVRTELLNYARDGTPYWIDIRIVPLLAADGSVQHFAAIERDITHQKQLESRLRRLAMTDSLTGVANRHAFFEFAETELNRARRYATPLGLILFDVDHFKAINDRHGHAVGDQALQRLVDVCQTNLRDTDLLARLGGEEFVVMLRDTPLAAAGEAAERLRRNVAATPIGLTDRSLTLRISCGVTAFARNVDRSIDHLLARADTALYTAKSKGRDRVCLRDPAAGDGSAAES